MAKKRPGRPKGSGKKRATTGGTTTAKKKGGRKKGRRSKGIDPKAAVKTLDHLQGLEKQVKKALFEWAEAKEIAKQAKARYEQLLGQMRGEISEPTPVLPYEDADDDADDVAVSFAPPADLSQGTPSHA